MALGLTQPPKEISAQGISWGKRQPVHRADELTTLMCPLYRNSGSLNLLDP